MKRILPFILLILLCFSACAKEEKSIRFYYPKAEFDYQSEQSILGSEIREAPGHEENLSYLLALYLEGPVDQDLISPFPRKSAVEEYRFSDQTLEIIMNERFADMDDLQHTIASACIAQTFFELTDAEQIIIKYTSVRYGSKTISLTKDSLVLTDNAVVPSQPAEP